MKLATTLIITALAAAGIAQAQAAAPTPAQQARTACADDIKSMCADAKDNRAVMACLRTNKDKASSGCQDALSKLPAPRAPQN